MSEKDRYKLLKLLSTSDTPLWLTEHNQLSSELERAADWMTSLGYSARNGFSVHYRELKENELYEPTLVRLFCYNPLPEQCNEICNELAVTSQASHAFHSIMKAKIPGE